VKIMSSAPTVVFTVPVFQTITYASTSACSRLLKLSLHQQRNLGSISYVVAEQKAVADMRLGEVVIVPLLAPPEGGLADFTYAKYSPNSSVGAGIISATF
jgi:hypothetical protein